MATECGVVCGIATAIEHELRCYKLQMEVKEAVVEVEKRKSRDGCNIMHIQDGWPRRCYA
ncbi:hypothetical protein C5167_022515 [Papaver somniferum]|uniref:Uncharacterized protein n=1 Tax=Papaver somniferum TaxID=3469 RepID=A0A4Y7JL40_PAPSO|nr:hypothetical protein C5167_022515 [Papaver somniferum]